MSATTNGLVVTVVSSIVGGVVGEVLLRKTHPLIGFVGGALAGYGVTALLSKKT